MTEQEYQQLVTDCARATATDRTLDDVLTDPRGPASYAIGDCDLDALYSAVVMTLETIGMNLYSETWCGNAPREHIN